MSKKIRIGCGAGFSGDRLEPALVLVQQGNLDYLVLECLAERTIALAQKRKLADPTQGYDLLLEKRMEMLLPTLVKNNVCLITNMGAANPVAAAKITIEIAHKLGLQIKVAAISGDDVTDDLSIINDDLVVIETTQPLKEHEVVSANAYLGIDGILEALKLDSQVIITGRVADPSLFLAPMIHEFNWATDDYNLLAQGTVIGHLMECAGQLTGGYFADGHSKIVPDLANLGHPFVDVFADGTGIISKVEGTGGVVNLQTVKEQLLYEVTNPYEYITPDVIVDFTTVQLKDLGNNQVQVTGGTGNAKPEKYKVSVGYKAFWLGEGEISYAGPYALERAKLAGQIVEERLKKLNIFTEIQIDYIGLNSMFLKTEIPATSPTEIRLRVATKAQTQAEAALIGQEVEALYTNGPAGGGAVRKYTNEIIGIVSVLIDRDKVRAKVINF